MKDKKIFFLTLKEKLGRYLVRSSKICTALKSSFFHCEEYMKAKIMSRVLDVVGETTDFRGDTRTDGHGFFERLPHKSPFGAIMQPVEHYRHPTFRGQRQRCGRIQTFSYRWICFLPRWWTDQPTARCFCAKRSFRSCVSEIDRVCVLFVSGE